MYEDNQFIITIVVIDETEVLSVAKRHIRSPSIRRLNIPLESSRCVGALVGALGGALVGPDVIGL